MRVLEARGVKQACCQQMGQSQWSGDEVSSNPPTGQQKESHGRYKSRPFARITTTDMARRLKMTREQIRYAESTGKLPTARRDQAGRRYWLPQDLPDDDSVMTTREMARALGISESSLRHLEKKGKVPAAKRETSGKRMWKKGDVGRIGASVAMIRNLDPDE